MVPGYQCRQAEAAFGTPVCTPRGIAGEAVNPGQRSVDINEGSVGQFSPDSATPSFVTRRAIIGELFGVVHSTISS